MWAIVLLAVVGIVLLRTFASQLNRSRADVNVATLVLTVIALVTLLVWFVRFSSYAAGFRWAVGVTALAAAMLLPAIFRIDDVDGDLVPRLALRWQTVRDRGLQTPQAAKGAADLASTTPDDFPQFLGPRRDNRLPDVLLQTDWNAHPPRLIWRDEIGAGWSAFSAVNGFALTMEQRGDEELVTCRDVATGRIRWFHAVHCRHESVLGGVGPRSTPTIDQGRVYALGATGVLRCLDGATGEELWRDDILARLERSPEADLWRVSWGRAASPLIVDNLVVVPWGGDRDGRRASLAAYDKATGKVVWTGGEHEASYSSPTLATLCGVRQILIVSQDFVTAHDPSSGSVLWQCDWPGNSAANASVSQPVPVGDDLLLLTKGYSLGAKLVQIRRDGHRWSVDQRWANFRVLNTKFTNVVVQEGFAYGLSDGILECVDLADGRRRWKGGRYGQGQVLGVGDCLLVQAESGEIALVAATPEGHQQLAAYPALEGKTWNNPCLYGRWLLVRNAQQAACYELALRGRQAAPQAAQAPRRSGYAGSILPPTGIGLTMYKSFSLRHLEPIEGFLSSNSRGL